ncbi:MAG: hypothetical protein IAA31_03545 [Candidatus Anaerobiospirillum merdipullorum]|uniref:DNA gyrase subunit B n=1 Tax=Candidatus Anaerobiospirillum merdipullorum TaxID=2838450 RepID=A0A9E2KNC3_9GAMM|nr:hypothetical protein [Candidatus Anaerobiospirillum merdipullorum]
MLSRIKAVIGVISALCLVLWPFIIAYGLYVDKLGLTLGVLAAISLLRVFTLPHNKGSLRPLLIISALIALGLCVLSLVLRGSNLFMYYPVAVNVLFLGVFALSLLQGPPIIERLARLTEPDLPPYAIKYVRKVTIAWCVFFILNGTLAWLTVWWGNLKWWTLYNGGIAYLLMGVMFAGEYLLRLKMRRHYEHA